MIAPPAPSLSLTHSLYGHIATMAEEIKKGIEKNSGVTADIFQVAETLPEEVLTKMHAPPKVGN